MIKERKKPRLGNENSERWKRQKKGNKLEMNIKARAWMKERKRKRRKRERENLDRKKEQMRRKARND